jgi:hypothetical protein
MRAVRLHAECPPVSPRHLQITESAVRDDRSVDPILTPKYEWKGGVPRDGNKR